MRRDLLILAMVAGGMVAAACGSVSAAQTTARTTAQIATLHENASETRARWKPAYDTYFPSDTDRANAIFVEVEIERMELWIRGVTPEPFGLRAAVLERDAGGWRLIGG